MVGSTKIQKLVNKKMKTRSLSRFCACRVLVFPPTTLPTSRFSIRSAHSLLASLSPFSAQLARCEPDTQGNSQQPTQLFPPPPSSSTKGKREGLPLPPLLRLPSPLFSPISQHTRARHVHRRRVEVGPGANGLNRAGWCVCFGFFSCWSSLPINMDVFHEIALNPGASPCVILFPPRSFPNSHSDEELRTKSIHARVRGGSEWSESRRVRGGERPLLVFSVRRRPRRDRQAASRQRGLCSGLANTPRLSLPHGCPITISAAIAASAA